jgi:hypothetical protein
MFYVRCKNAHRAVTVCLALSFLATSLAVVPDFQLMQVPPVVKVDTDKSVGTGTIICDKKNGDGSQTLWVLTADHVLRPSGTKSKPYADIKVITNSLAGGKTLNLVAGTLASGGANGTTDIAIFAVKYVQDADKIDFSKYVAGVGVYTGGTKRKDNWFTDWGYGVSGRPSINVKNVWDGYSSGIDDGKLRFQNNVVDATIAVKPGEISTGDNYAYEAIQFTLDRYSATDKASLWVNGEGATFKGDSGGPYLMGAKQSDYFKLEIEEDYNNFYNGPQSNLKDGKIQIPFYTDALVGVHTYGASGVYKEFGKAVMGGVPITKDVVDWIKKGCGECEIRSVPEPIPPAQPGPPLTEARENGSVISFVVLCCLAIAGLLLPRLPHR